MSSHFFFFYPSLFFCRYLSSVFLKQELLSLLTVDRCSCGEGGYGKRMDGALRVEALIMDDAC